MTSTCMDTRWEPWTVGDRVSEKQNIVSQMYSKIKHWQSDRKHYLNEIPASKHEAAACQQERSTQLVTCDIHMLFIGMVKDRVPEMQNLSLVQADDHCAADREQNSRNLKQSCHASDVQCLHSNARTIYTGISLSGQSLYICLFVANYAVICVWSLNYSVEVDIALAMKLSVSVAIRKQRRARYVNVKYRWSDAISKIEIYTLAWETMYVIQN